MVIFRLPEVYIGGNTHPLTSYDSGYLKCPCFDSLPYQETTCINLLMPRCLRGLGQLLDSLPDGRSYQESYLLF